MNLQLSAKAPFPRHAAKALAFFDKARGGRAPLSLTFETFMELSLSERDKRVIWHPYTPQKYMPEPIPIVKGEGVMLTDAAGHQYIDAISSWWVTLHGHSHPYIAQKIYEQALQLEQVIFAGFTHEPAITLAERLLEILPGPCSKIFYSDDGSTATEVAVKMALQYWFNKGEKTRSKILAFNGGYHGDTFGAMSVSGRSVFTLAFREKLFDVIFIDPPGSIDIEKWEEQIAGLPWPEIACFIYEPMIQGAGGMNIYPAEGLDHLLKIAHNHQAICIADEVMTGFGRTGKMFASEYMEQQPDIVCLSKGLTGGTMPLGVTAVNEKVYEAFYEDNKLKTFFHGHSFTANPLACTAALASLDLLQQENCYWQTKMIAASHTEFLNGALAAQSKKIKNRRRLGTILAFEIESGNDGYLNSISRDITMRALDKGVYLRPLGNTVYMMPPYCISQQQLAKLYEVVIEITSQID